MGTFPTHNNERERKVEGILVFLYPCPHKAKFLLFSSTHNRSNKFRITKFPTAQACLYLKYTTIKCLTHVYFKYRLLMFYSTVSDSYLIIRNPVFTISLNASITSNRLYWHSFNIRREKCKMFTSKVFDDGPLLLVVGS